MQAILARQKLTGLFLTERGQSGVLAVFTATLFLSALLLFSVQPLFAKLVLPQLGGSPSVWAISTCFFQGILFAGYCYAHILNRYCPPVYAPILHLALLFAAYLLLPVGLPANITEPPSDGAYLWLTGVLAAGVGLPFFAVSANAPLLQAWFSRTGNAHAKDPYFLYGASNLGSLLALLGYPTLIEPFFGLSVQAALWTKAFLLLAAALSAAGILMVSAQEVVGQGDAADAQSQERVSAPSSARIMMWVLFSAVPSGLLVAFTTHLSTDIAAAPFLWVVPLAMFLMTFVMVFRDPPLIRHDLLVRLQPLLVAVAILTLSGPSFDTWQSSAAAFACFIVTTLVAHRALYEDRPHASHLTAFYLWMSFGGVIGGIFSAVVAPQIFNSTYEFPLLLTLGMLCRPGTLGRVSPTQLRTLACVAGVSVFAVVLGLAIGKGGSEQQAYTFGVSLVAIGLLSIVLAAKDAKLQALLIGSIALVVVVLPSTLNRGNPLRSFFGVLRVIDSDSGKVRRFLHGTTNHGAQRLVDAAGRKIERPLPATYYHAASPMALAVDIARSAKTVADKPFRAGIIGLGIGSMACYSKPEEAWRFYEIDAAVLKIAADPAKFNFLSACRPNADVVLGDARLTIAKEGPQSFDYLQIDAFSSDAVPTHLLTVEAVRLYLDKLSDNGVLTMHVSNRHLDLAPVAAAAALAVPGTHVTVVKSTPPANVLDASPSVVVVVTKAAAQMALVSKWPDARLQSDASVAPWTDDYSDIVSALWRVYGPDK